MHADGAPDVEDADRAAPGDAAVGEDHAGRGAGADGVAHLQVAARELLAAARSFLDLVEEVVNDDQRLTSVVESVTDAVKGAARSVGDLGGRTASTGNGPRVEHIDLD